MGEFVDVSQLSLDGGDVPLSELRSPEDDIAPEAEVFVPDDTQGVLSLGEAAAALVEL
jgi:hypothetical protein